MRRSLYLRDELSRLGGGETVPTRAAVQAARAARDQAWLALRQAGVGLAGAAGDAFERLRDAADQLADRRADEAQRVSAYLGAMARLDRLAARRGECSGTSAQRARAAADARRGLARRVGASRRGRPRPRR